MKRVDPLICELFVHVRRAIDILEDLVLRAQTPADNRQRPEPVAPPPQSPPALLTDKLTYSVKEVQKLVGLSRSLIYRAIGNKELRVLKLGKRTMISATDLQSWINSWPSSR